MSSPTPREVRRLASDHDFVFEASGSPSSRRLGWWAFVATHLSLPCALFAGAIFVIVAIVYTSATSKQMLDCPAWAMPGSCNRADDWTVQHLATVQGIITLVYFIGMVALTHVALALCEAAVWPLLAKQVFTIRQLEAYISTTRGSILSAPGALMAIKTAAAGIVLACAITVTLLPLAAPPLVGYAFTPTWMPVQMESSYISGSGGIGELYAQTDPPTSVMVGVLAKYNAWATDPASEPLPEFRDWYVDRDALSQRGSFSGAAAVRLQTSISCRPHKLQQVNRDGLLWNAFLTNMTRSRNSYQKREIWVRTAPQLTLWVDQFAFVSAHRTQATLIFAALNGTIDGGDWTPAVLGNMTGASSVACEVDVEAMDTMFAVPDQAEGSVPPAAANQAILSSLANLKVSSSAPAETAINEILLWFTAAPLMVGSSVDGTQPMFFNSTDTDRPVPYTSSIKERNTWTKDGIESFIRIAVGALAQATSTTTSSNSNTTMNQTLTSTIKTRKLDPARALLLIILPILAIGIMIGLAWWNACVHAREGVPVMRLAGAGEMLKSAQTSYLREHAATDAAKTYLPNELGGMEIKYGVDKDGIVGLARSVRGFNGGRR
ncbi:hypothetical protein B0H66DRAFT_494292, partial [Apodospora peruviana]